ncbi:TetR family transcriptional regulator [Knoellia remsis]|uniref:TetR family transcriptional regulator n=2 Tax=Knoellia remsis TaxID=407159 RepID=A0A2T0UJI0_9MICO|nr:TetR family transcriptional regulator [Knoellia remsis]
MGWMATTQTTEPTLRATGGGRRAELLDAAVSVLSDAGMRGLTHRAVDAEAGLPEGTCSAYFRSREALLIGLAEHVRDQLTRDVDALTSSATDHADDPDALATEVTDLALRWLRRPAVLRALAELALEAPRRPPLLEVFEVWRTGIVTLVSRIVVASGRTDADVAAPAAVAAIEGVLASATRLPAAQREPFVRTAIAVLVRGFHESR